MGNVQQAYSSPFIFPTCDIPAKPFAAEKGTVARRRIQIVGQQSRTEDRTTEDESSMTPSIPYTSADSIRLRSRSTHYRTILQRLIELQDWQRVLCRVELYPHEVTQFMPILVDTFQNESSRQKIHLSPPSRGSMPTNNPSVIFVTPLHLVCALNAPLIVVITILRLGGPETASMSIRPSITRNKRLFRKQLFSRHRRHLLIRSRDNKSQRSHNQKSDDQSQISDSTPSTSSKWQILQSASSDSSAWNHKINFRFSFDDYRRRVKFAMQQRRSRGGAFPIVEELNEESGEEDGSESNHCSVDMFDAHPHVETQPSSIVTGKITTAITADCSQSHQSSISVTPPRSSISDQSVILQLSSSGGVCPLPLRKIENMKSPDISSEQNRNLLGEQSEIITPTQVARELNPSFKPLQSTDCTNHMSFFRVQWDLWPLLRHVLAEGSLLPLHVAVLYSASSAIIHALVDAYPLAALRDVLGMLPIHCVAAGWLLPPLLPLPASVVLENIDISHVLENVGTNNHPGILQNLKALQHAVPDSIRIRSGSNGMKPEEYINECMVDSPYKDACLRVLNEGMSISPSKDSSGLFDIDMSITSSIDDIFDFSESIQGSVHEYIENNPDFRPLATAGIEPPSEYLSSLIAAKDWHRIFVAIEAYPSLASQWIYGIDDVSASIYKRLPLHCACIYGGPIDLIEMLIRLYPQGIKTIDPTDLSTPLSLACFASCSADIIRLLLRTYPRAIDIVNIYGQAPLHVAILSKASYDTIEMLVDETPHLALLKDNDGMNAITYAKVVYGEKHTVYQFLITIKDVLLNKKLHC
jgi:Ankyrin repeats (3 copies)